MAVVSADVPVNSVAEALLEDGYVIVERLATDLTARALAATLRREDTDGARQPGRDDDH